MPEEPSQMGLVRANVTTWWESKLPAHVPHRRVLLDATVRMSQFWAASSQLFQSVPDCADLSTRCEAAAQVSGRYADLERWAAGLSHDAAGTVELAGGGRTGAHGAIKRWLLVEARAVAQIVVDIGSLLARGAGAVHTEAWASPIGPADAQWRAGVPRFSRGGRARAQPVEEETTA
ncbi:unnamed protein product [Prorocentrum cordatum]|uniref:Uncharacterized protein n=1 Tax=Prorocentrum cordatum TaxID=2364126 RepID=A0ABN9RFB9_9DINO|nr:unnamed protein product [Polarella glacialis]